MLVGHKKPDPSKYPPYRRLRGRIGAHISTRVSLFLLGLRLRIASVRFG